MNIKKLLGKRIQEVRKSKKLTQEKIAEAINIETSSLSNIENGKYYPTADNLEKIIDILEVKPSELFTFEYMDLQNDLMQEMILAMESDEKLTRLMYKFFMTVKY